MNINEVLQYFGFGTLLIAAFVYIYSTARKGRADILRLDNTDLSHSNAELRRELESIKSKADEQSKQIEYFKEIATQTPEVKMLIGAITSQQEIAGKQHKEVIDQLSSVVREISGLAKVLKGSK